MRRIAALVPFLIVALCLPSWAAVRPSLAVVPTQASFPAEDARLAARVRRLLSDLHRFELPELHEPTSEPGFHGPQARAEETAKEAGANILVLLGFDQDPTGRFVRITDLEGRYVAASDVEWRLIDVTNDHELLRKVVPFRGESPSSKEVAEEEGYKQAALTIARDIQAFYRLKTTVRSRDGRHVTLSEGSDLGLQPDLFFSKESDTGEPIGRIRVTSVATDSAQGELISGYYDLHAGDTVVEQAYATMPASAGLAHAEWLGPVPGSFTGLSLDYNRSGYGLGAGLEFGQLTQGGAVGFALMPRMVLQHELLPERFCVYAEGGIAGALLNEPAPGANQSASSYSLHALVGAGVATQLPWNFGASLGLRYLTPWLAANWSQSTGIGESQDVSASVPHPLIGGWGPLASVIYIF